MLHRAHSVSDRVQVGSRALRLPFFMYGEDVDYVSAFCTAAYVNRLVELRGPTTGRLIRRSILYQALGDHAQSAADAETVLRSDPDNAEAHFRLGASSLALAVQQVHEVPRGPGAQSNSPSKAPATLLAVAKEAFQAARRLNPADEEASEALQATKRVIAALSHKGRGAEKGPRSKSRSR